MTSRVGVVLTGGGARGAYQAGALDVLVPALDRRGERPVLHTGASAGAINVLGLTGTRHLPARDATAELVARWRQATAGRVLRPLWQQAPLTFLRYGAEVLSLPGSRLPSLLGVAPLEENLRTWVDWDAVHRNAASGLADTAIVATATRTGRSVAFTECACDLPSHRSHAVRYVRTDLDVGHVLASASIPVLFPAIRIERPPELAGWYSDGSTRLRTPLKPALDLGADHLLVVGTTTVNQLNAAPGPADQLEPDLGDAAVNVLNGVLEDALTEDMRRFGDVNAHLTGEGPSRASVRAYREVRGKAPYRAIPYAFVAPPTPGEIGALALEVFRSRYGGPLGALRGPEVALLHRLAGGDSPLQGDLLSYLLFDRVFLDALIALGRRDARAWLAETDGEIWTTAPLPSFVEDGAVA